MEANHRSISLGTTRIRIPPMGLGAWAWGDTFIWGYGKDFDRSDVGQAFTASIEAGMTFIDTAEIYGFGRSEEILGELIEDTSATVQVATKFMPYPWRMLGIQLDWALQASLHRLKQERVDLYQIHHPLAFRSANTWLRAMADQLQRGLIGAIGVSNFNLDQTKRAIQTLADYQIPLASNQVEYSLFDRSIEFSGLSQLCLDRGVTIIAYSPLAQGLLTGKYNAEHPPPGVRGRRFNKQTWLRLTPLIEAMERIGEDHGGHSPAQVALNWVMAKGAVPIPGAKNERQAVDNASALFWDLTPDEVAQLDRLSEPG